jgi:SAM-dependent methyltransferase
MAFTPRFPWFPNIEIFITRKELSRHIKCSLPFFKGKLLDVGCGVMPYRDFILQQSAAEKYIGLDLASTEIYKHIQPDLVWDGYSIPLPDQSVDSVLLTEVLEHCPEPSLVLKEVHRVLKNDGNVVFSVPFLWHLHESPWDFYRYTPYAIKKLFGDGGFSLEVLETFGSNDRAFLHAYFIWLKKGRLPKAVRFVIYLLTLPLILLFLAFTKSRNRRVFEDGQIFIGIVGVAKKRNDKI